MSGSSSPLPFSTPRDANALLGRRIHAIVLGGGRGTRLSPLTLQRCKPAVPLAGKYRLVDIPISNCLNSGVNRVFVLTQFNTASLHQHIQQTYRFDAFGGGCVKILSAEQTEANTNWYQGTADAVRRNLQHVGYGPEDLVLILSGDQLYRMDYRGILADHVARAADVTVAAIPFPASRVEGLGLMRVDDSLRIHGFVEKPRDPAVINGLAVSGHVRAGLRISTSEPVCLGSMGIYVFTGAALTAALQGSMSDFGREVLPGLLANKRVMAFLFEDYWEDIGTIRAFFDANLALAQPLPPFDFFDPDAPIYTEDRYLPHAKLNRCAIDHVVIGDGSIVTDSTLRRCVLGVRCYVGEGSVLEDTILMGSDSYESKEQQRANAAEGRPRIGIGQRCGIYRAIIDKNARIGNDCSLNPVGKHDGDYLGGAVVIRDGILIVPKNATVPAGSVV